MNTLASMRASILRWLRGSKVDNSQINDAINDAIESLFSTLIRASLSIHMGGPTQITLSSGTQGANVVSIADPTVAPTVSDVAAQDGSLAGHDVECAYTYVTDSGTETLASPTTEHSCAMGFVASVAPPAIVDGAFGWNLYAKTGADGNLVKQNEGPLPFATVGGTGYVEPDAGFTNDPDDPQLPTENTTGDNIFYIRHMEVVTSSGLLQSWNQGDLDSDMMRRLGRVFAGNSEFQPYGFDLINQRQIEIRPAIGSSVNARYFYIVKPRRLLFDGSSLPFPTVAGQIEFIREFSLSAIFLSLREIQLAREWDTKAEKSRTRCELAVGAMNRPKNQRVTAFIT